MWAGGTLLAVYSLGLGLPFLLSGLLLGRLSGALGWVKRHFVLIVGGSAVVIGAFGLLLMFDELSRLSLHLQTWLTDAHLEMARRAQQFAVFRCRGVSSSGQSSWGRFRELP